MGVFTGGDVGAILDPISRMLDCLCFFEVDLYWFGGYNGRGISSAPPSSFPVFIPLNLEKNGFSEGVEGP